MVRETPIEAPVILAVGLGLRRTEVLGLKWKEVDLVTSRISIVEGHVNYLHEFVDYCSHLFAFGGGL